MPDTQLNWLKCQGEVWCKLSTVNLSHPHFEIMTGVYIIWHGPPSPATVYVGQGKIRDQLTAHRTDARIQRYADMVLYVTWATVPQQSMDGVVAYLAERLRPKVGDARPNVSNISTNLPW